MDYNIFGLNITMDDVLNMQIIDSITDLPDDLHYLFLSKWYLFLERLIKISILTELK